MIILLAVVAMISLRVGLRVVTGSLQSLAAEANRIAQGNLDHPLQVDGVDEVGQLRRAFEQMRSSLQARLDESIVSCVSARAWHPASRCRIRSSRCWMRFFRPAQIQCSVVFAPIILPDTFVELPLRFAVGIVQKIVCASG